MNYITNKSNQIIAADEDLLKLLHVENIEKLTRDVILGDIRFEMHSDKNMHIVTGTKSFSFESHTSSLSSIMGSFNLVSLNSIKEHSENIVIPETQTPNEPSTETFPEEDDFLSANVSVDPSSEFTDDIEDDLVFIKEDDAPITLISPKEGVPSDDDDSIDLFIQPDIQPDNQPSIIEEEDNADILFDLTVPQIAEETIDEITINETEDSSEDFILENKKSTQDTSPIIIDVKPISTDIGVSTQDYKLFLNEYIDTAISLEKDIRSTDSQKCSSAVASLSQLSQVLQLPFVNEIMSKVTSQSSDKNELIESFYDILSRLTIEEKSDEEISLQNVLTDVTTEEVLVSETPDIQDIDIKETLVPETPHIKEESAFQIEPKITEEGFGSISLEGIAPIRFQFKLSEAANDLSLPVELIEEFVHDFIEQAHVETDKMLVAYEKGDLKTIQNIGHMLKGASSNLRINTLSDTLYEIQFCENSSNLENLIKQYWGQFLSLEQQIDNLAK